MDNYIIVLFKNKKKKKLIKGYRTENNARNKFRSLIKENDIKFHVSYENSLECKYELGLLTNQQSYQQTLFLVDDIGRNVNVELEDNNEYVFLDITHYKIEEKIFDWQKNDRITFNELLSKYCPKTTFKSISTLNNKLIIQVEDDFKLFSLKNESDAHRLLSTIESEFFQNGRNDAIFVRDTSTTQRKWLYDVLEKNGYDRKKLYRQNTTFSERKYNPS
jgi:hypothetical protein